MNQRYFVAIMEGKQRNVHYSSWSWQLDTSECFQETLRDHSLNLDRSISIRDQSRTYRGYQEVDVERDRVLLTFHARPDWMLRHSSPFGLNESDNIYPSLTRQLETGVVQSASSHDGSANYLERYSHRKCCKSCSRMEPTVGN